MSQPINDLLRKQELQDDEMISLNAMLLKAVGEGNYEVYKLACDEKLSCFEPEAKGHLVTGLDFHKYYFDMPKDPNKTPSRASLAAPSITWMCQRRAAIVCFKRLVQAGTNTLITEETRVWEFSENLKQWKLVHFHRSPGAS